MSRVRRQELLLREGGGEALRFFFDFFRTELPYPDLRAYFFLYCYSAEIAGARVRSMPLRSENAIPTRRRTHQTSQKAAFFSRQSQKTVRHPRPLDALKKVLQAARDTVVVFDEACAEFSGLS